MEPNETMWSGLVIERYSVWRCNIFLGEIFLEEISVARKFYPGTSIAFFWNTIWPNWRYLIIYEGDLKSVEAIARKEVTVFLGTQKKLYWQIIFQKEITLRKLFRSSRWRTLQEPALFIRFGSLRLSFVPRL